MFTKSFRVQAVSSFLFGIIGALFFHLVFTHAAPKIAVIDITGLVKSFESELIKQKLPTDELSKEVTEFGKALNSVVDEYSKNLDYILFPREVVLSVRADKTAEVRDLIKKRMGT